MTLIDIIVAITLLLILAYVPYASTVALFACLIFWGVAFILFFIRFCQKNPSLWQMDRAARRAALALKEIPPAKDKLHNELANKTPDGIRQSADGSTKSSL